MFHVNEKTIGVIGKETYLGSILMRNYQVSSYKESYKFINYEKKLNLKKMANIIYLRHPSYTKFEEKKNYLKYVLENFNDDIRKLKKEGFNFLIFTGSYWENKKSIMHSKIYIETKNGMKKILKSEASLEFKVIYLKLYDVYGPLDNRNKLLSKFYNNTLDVNIKINNPNNLIYPVHFLDIKKGMEQIVSRKKLILNPFTEFSFPSSQTIKVKDLIESYKTGILQNVNLVMPSKIETDTPDWWNPRILFTINDSHTVSIQKENNLN